MKIDFKSNIDVSSDELIRIFNSVGWSKNPEDIVSAFRNSYYVTAYDDGKLVGFARAISDGHYYTGIYDVVVEPSYQNKGIAKELMKMLLRRFKGTYFFLSYTPGNKEFYERCGFEELSSGMWIERQKSFNLDLDNL